MSSVMNMSLGALKELLNNSKNAVLVQTNQYVNTDTVLAYASSSYDFVKGHKAEIAGAGVAGLVAWYLA